MITEEQLFEVGWKRFGDEENDPYYKIILEPKVFGLHDLSGNIMSDGSFNIYSIQTRIFNEVREIIELFHVNGFVVNQKLMSRYGSNNPLNK